MAKLSSEIAKAEGKKSQVSIGNIREILAILVDMELKKPGCVHSELSKMVQKKIKAKK